MDMTCHPFSSTAGLLLAVTLVSSATAVETAVAPPGSPAQTASVAEAVAGSVGDLALAQQRYGDAWAVWQPAAGQGDPVAQYGLGLLLETGRGVARDYPEALRWYRLAAAQQEPRARYRLGVLSQLGLGMPPDPLAAVAWLTLAANSGATVASSANAYLDSFSGQLDPDLLDRGRALAADWAGQWGDPVVVVKAPIVVAADPDAPLMVVRSVEPVAAPEPASEPASEPAPRIDSDADADADADFAAAPIQATAIEPPPVAAAIIDSSALADLRCGPLRVETQQDQHTRIAGNVASAAAATAVREQLARSHPEVDFDFALTPVGDPLCQVLRLLATSAGLATEELKLSVPDSADGLADGAPLIMQVQPLDFAGRLHLDYFLLDGKVVHLLPAAGEPMAMSAALVLGDPAGGGPTWEISAPFGAEMILGVVTSDPLFDNERPAIEPGEPYLRELLARIEHQGNAASGGGRIAVGNVLIRTRARE